MRTLAISYCDIDFIKKGFSKFTEDEALLISGREEGYYWHDYYRTEREKLIAMFLREGLWPVVSGAEDYLPFLWSARRKLWQKSGEDYVLKAHMGTYMRHPDGTFSILVYNEDFITRYLDVYYYTTEDNFVSEYKNINFGA